MVVGTALLASIAAGQVVGVVAVGVAMIALGAAILHYDRFRGMLSQGGILTPRGQGVALLVFGILWLCGSTAILIVQR